MKESEKKDIFGPCLKTKKEYKVDSDKNWNRFSCDDSQSFGKKENKKEKSEQKSRPSRQQDCQDRLEYWKESGRPEETCCLLGYKGKAPAHTGMKISYDMIWW